MICVEVDTVKTNIDAYTAEQKSPYECKIHDGEGNAVADFETACHYFYLAKDGTKQLLNTEYCECSLMQEKPADEPQEDGDDLPRFYE